MEQNYIDIEASIRKAQQLRSEAFGSLIFTSWDNGKQMLIKLMDLPARRASRDASSMAFFDYYRLP